MPATRRLVALPGEGVGPEVVDAALDLLARTAPGAGVAVEVEVADFGIPALERHGSHLPESTAARCAASDGILLGAVEQGGLLELRSRFDFFANLRPVQAIDCLLDASSLRPERLRGLDILFVRELTSGIHFGEAGRGSDADGEFGFHTMRYSDAQLRRIARVALARADGRRRRLAVAHKENALPHIPWCEITRKEARDFPTVEIETLLVDNLGMQLVHEPTRFDVILAGNLIGDWLSSLGGALVGSLGLLPSASLNADGLGLYEPIHGTAPEIAGRGIANPLGAISSLGMMLEQWGERAYAHRLASACRRVLEAGCRTPDLATGRDGEQVLDTRGLVDRIVDAFEAERS